MKWLTSIHSDRRIKAGDDIFRVRQLLEESQEEEKEDRQIDLNLPSYFQYREIGMEKGWSCKCLSPEVRRLHPLVKETIPHSQYVTHIFPLQSRVYLACLHSLSLSIIRSLTSCSLSEMESVREKDIGEVEKALVSLLHSSLNTLDEQVD